MLSCLLDRDLSLPPDPLVQLSGAMKFRQLGIGLALAIASTASAQIAISITETAANTYTISVTNTGATFDLSGGNDAVSIGKGIGGPDFTVPGINSYPTAHWDLFPTDPDTTTSKSFQAKPDFPANEYTSGQFYDFVILTDSAASSFQVDYVFELGDGGNSWVGSSEVAVSAVPEPAQAGLLTSLVIVGLCGVRRRRR